MILPYALKSIQDSIPNTNWNVEMEIIDRTPLTINNEVMTSVSKRVNEYLQSLVTVNLDRQISITQGDLVPAIAKQTGGPTHQPEVKSKAVRAQIVRHGALVLTSTQETIKIYIQKHLRIKDEAAVEAWPVATYDTARRYNRGDKFVNGPDYMHPILDWQFPDLTPWTKALLRKFSADFFAQYKANQLPTLHETAISMADIERAFYICVLVMKNDYSKKMSHTPTAVRFQRDGHGTGN
ncbi:hypothetical protein CPB86DRAFT_802674 [Serendipita vermifera]|nr:hypothetical protein CPB86DRAFT_802674 [Serendipita vermifera]